MSFDIVGFGYRRAILAGAIGAAILSASAVSLAAGSQEPAYLAAFPNFAPRVTPQMPGDVDIDLKERLEHHKEFAEVQREFDLNAWQMFLALNWPTNDKGQPAPGLDDTAFGAPHWTLWHNGSTIFQDKGAVPAACAQAPKQRQLVLSRDLTLPVSPGLTPFHMADNQVVNPRTTRFLGVISAVGELNAANTKPAQDLSNDILQAFTGPLIDQNGNFVFYEIMVDPNEVSYLCDHKLYNVNGQVAFTQGGGKTDFPFGHPAQDWSGAFELKLAWKILVPRHGRSKPVLRRRCPGHGSRSGRQAGAEGGQGGLGRHAYRA